MNKKIALITGVAGQDGSYLAELLLDKDYKVYGLAQSSLSQNNENWRISHIASKLFLHSGDVSDYTVIYELVKAIKPDEIYHLATKHEVGISLQDYLDTQKTNINSVYYFLSAIKELKSDCKFFFASSSKIFGKALLSPQNEQTVFAPNSIYSISKVSGMNLVKMYRDEQGVFACSGILYNHESPRRDFNFLPRKITQAAARIKAGKEKELALGNIDAKRDWGYAKDYVEGMWLMLQADKPDDYVIGTGEIHSVKDILDIAFKEVGLDWKKYVVINKEFFRKEGDIPMVADISKIKNKLKWQPKISFEELIKMMVQNDLKLEEVIWADVNKMI